MGLFNFSSKNVLLQDFKCDDFDLKYPKKWKNDYSENQYSFYYNPNLGELRISVYKDGEKFSEEELKTTLLNLKESQGANPEIKTSNVNGTLTAECQYTEDGYRSYLKAIQQDKKLFFISLFWREESWDTFEKELLESYNSIRCK